MNTTTARSRVRGTLVTGVAVVALFFSILSPWSPSAATPANAAPVTGFDPGNIIDDAVFYDGYAWDAGQIQSFLNQQVPRCTINDPGRGQWTWVGNNMVSSVCLKDAQFTTATRAANAYCKAYAGGTNESAATVIAKVSRACGISPKVLLVMLEKEQSLVTDSWPFIRQYEFAMGYACPDSGPNNSANCDPSQQGFPMQVYRAAWQLQVYKAHPASYRYRPFQTNAIQWHPNVGCGTSQVYISNWATAALYIYTPYRPNQAALNAGWGTGDSCSSYGNRNFFNFYTSWFGSVRGGVTVDPKFTAHWNANGGASGIYGKPIASSIAHGNTIVTQDFERGTMYYNSWLGVTAVNGAIGTLYRSLDTIMKLGPWGPLAYPVGPEVAVAGGVRQKFANGEIYWSAATGAQAMNGSILSFYQNNGGPSGRFGFPTSAMVSTPSGWRQDFVGGAIFVNRQNGKIVPLGNGAFLSGYRAGGFVDAWGWPTDLVACRLVHDGCTLLTTKGTIAYSPASGIQLVSSRLLATWGSPSSALGYPTGPEVAVAGGVRQKFANGEIYWSAATGAQAMNGSILSFYQNNGGPSGRFGFPTSAMVSTPSGWRQDFVGGAIFVNRQNGKIVPLGNGAFLSGYRAGGFVDAWGWPTDLVACRLVHDGCTLLTTKGTIAYSPASGIQLVSSRLLATWGSPSSALGYPTGPEVAVAGGVRQKFANGEIYWSAATGAQAMNGSILSFYQNNGGPSGRFGFPTSAMVSTPSGWRQDFVGGAIFVNRQNGSVVLMNNGAMLQAYRDAGYVDGSWGWPVSAAVCTSNGDCTMKFAKGIAYYTLAHGAWFVADVTAPRSNGQEPFQVEQPTAPVEQESASVGTNKDQESAPGAQENTSSESQGGSTEMAP
ncbi:hypothetical protein G7067_04675 [Leucobacter insecticola]|uniref:LGFP repeat-containing protein n=1 Tax=Leucobacter insecticola TaxID=2714934 RepID=A0A6G8FHW0_9MICO|nr:hypothetical protein [Leucobacter insecticola]QIM15869.1 hypothetical protein G7067_04675 [Leucobacter insecticola]